MSYYNKLLFSILLLAASSGAVQAVPHISGQPFGPKDYVRPAGKPREVYENGIRKIISPVTGTHKIAIILANFPSADPTSTSGAPAMNSSDILGFTTTFVYLKNFYNEASYGTLKLDITFISGTTGSVSSSILTGAEIPIVMTHPMQWYGTGDEAGNATGLVALIKEAIYAVHITSADYDTVLVAHAGYGNESTYTVGDPFAGDIWSAVVGWTTSPGDNVNGFTDGGTFPAREASASPIGVTCHEFGHLLGFVDLYNTDTQASTVGRWCLYDKGTWINDGATPAHPCAWEKKLIGWVSPVVVNSASEITGVKSFETSSANIYETPILGNTKEYFLICYSAKSTYNPAEPGEGLLIWHIDEQSIDGVSYADRVANNSVNNYSHYTVNLVSADNTLPKTPPTYGSSSEPWPGAKTSFTSPDSNSYSGQTSAITITGIVFPGGLASFALSNYAQENILSISKVINYPNPAGPAYPVSSQKASGTMTTIALNLTRSPQKLSLTIYDLAGEKVRQVAGGSIRFRSDAGGPTGNNKWVYEYDWDGKNDSGAAVADGVYLYRVTADDQMKIGKLVVVR